MAPADMLDDGDLDIVDAPSGALVVDSVQP
jgi:hypothetical protein